MRLLALVPALLVSGVAVVTIACSHEPGPPPEVIHLDAPPIGDSGAGVAPTQTRFAKIDIPAPTASSTCPQPIHPGYCNFRCRTYSERESSHHAQRVSQPVRYALGTCGPYKAFAEEDKTGALIEIFDEGGDLLASIDERAEGCKSFLINNRESGLSCATKLDWHPSESN